MRAAWRWGIAGVLLWAAACTQDFSAFHFVDMKPARDLGDSSTARDSGAAEDDSGGVPAADAGRPADAEVDAERPAEPQTPDAAPIDAGMAMVPPPAAGAAGATNPDPPDPQPDAGMNDDAGGPVAPTIGEQCTARFPDLKVNSPACGYCGCKSCAAPIVDCLTQGDDLQRAQCKAVLACAIRNHCKDGACYCASSGCGYPSDSGDGPCAYEIENAAGGKRNRVTQLRQTYPPPLDEPFIRAVAAFTCLYGTDDASPGPAVMEQCATSCGL
jgi:hypothetical protein